MEESELRSLVKGWVEQSTSRGLRVFIVGKTGVGTSSLINTLFGKEIAKEGANLYSERRNIETIQETIEGVNITMWDSPGLKNPKIDESQTLKDIQENCKDIDIFVYCTSLTQIRIGQDEYDSIKNLTHALGDGIWKKGIIALTFANEVRPSPSSRATVEEYFRKRVSDCGETLRNTVKEAGVNAKIANDILVIPTSYRELPLPDTTGADWFSVFWTSCLQRARFISLPALLQIKRGLLLKDPVTSRAVEARATAERLRIVGDNLDKLDEQEEFNRMLENSPLFTQVLITTIQNPFNWRSLLVQGISLVSIGIFIMAIEHIIKRK